MEGNGQRAEDISELEACLQHLELALSVPYGGAGGGEAEEGRGLPSSPLLGWHKLGPKHSQPTRQFQAVPHSSHPARHQFRLAQHPSCL
ncbi:hypothetical protein Pcinc_022747 [Petrolisthes cinctipes]|uniref:Uncharacterized protein n=1 Tax=Petrolisthes cinctipes TaxID=88211 RepID=A0AAE1FD46_PETCI|nr:hypothetical protein Pcinc_022747 [Petrolisthes cinctipes]